MKNNLIHAMRLPPAILAPKTHRKPPTMACGMDKMESDPKGTDCGYDEQNAPSITPPTKKTCQYIAGSLTYVLIIRRGLNNHD
jgi:hypothetical protein